MKKILIAAMCVLAVLVAVIAVSKAKKPDSNTTTTVSSTETAETTTKKADKNNEDKNDSTQIVTKDPNKLVRITMPLSYYDAKNECDTEGFFDKSSYESCKVNKKDKTFTITIKSLPHDFMLTNVGLQVIKTLASFIGSEDYPYVKGLGKYNSNFSEIEIIVNKNGFNSSGSKDSLVSFVASCGIFYQLYTTENDYECTVIIKSEESDKVLKKETVRMDNNELDF